MNTEKLKSIIFNRRSTTPPPGNAADARQYLYRVCEVAKELNSNNPTKSRNIASFSTDVASISDKDAVILANEVKQFLSGPGIKSKIKLNFLRSCLPKNSANN